MYKKRHGASATLVRRLILPHLAAVHPSPHQPCAQRTGHSRVINGVAQGRQPTQSATHQQYHKSTWWHWQLTSSTARTHGGINNAENPCSKSRDTWWQSNTAHPSLTDVSSPRLTCITGSCSLQRCTHIMNNINNGPKRQGGLSVNHNPRMNV